MQSMLPKYIQDLFTVAQVRGVNNYSLDNQTRQRLSESTRTLLKKL